MAVTLWLALAVLTWLFPNLLGTDMPGDVGSMLTDTHATLVVQGLLFSGINLALGLSLAWLAPNDRTARWLAFGMVGTAAAFNFTAHSLLHAFTYRAGLGPDGASGIHIVFHIVVAASYAYALLLFPDGKLPPLSPLAWVLVALAVAVIISFVLSISFIGPNADQAIYVPILGLGVVVAGALGLGVKAIRSPDDAQRAKARSYALSFAFGVAVAGAFVFIWVRARGSDLLPAVSGLPKGERIVQILAPVLAAIPVVLFIGLIRDKLWGFNDPANKPKLYGALVAAVIVIFTTIELLIKKVAEESAWGNSLVMTFAILAVMGVVLERPRGQLMSSCRKLVYGIDNDPIAAMSDFSARLAGTISSIDVVPAFAETTRRCIGVYRGALTTRLLDGTVKREEWAVGPWTNQGTETIQLTQEDRPIGEVTVSKVTGRRLSGKERELVHELATEASVAYRSRVALEQQTSAARNRLPAREDG